MSTVSVSAKSTSVKHTKSTPTTATVAVAIEQVPVVESKPVKVQKAGRVAKVAEPTTVTPAVVAAPTVVATSPTKKATKASKATALAVVVPVAAPEPTVASPTKKGGKAQSVGAKTTKPTKVAKPLTEKKTSKAQAVAKPVAVQAEGEDCEDDESCRYFKVVVNGGQPHGRFSGSKPKQAAAKALTSLLRERQDNKQPVNEPIKFSIVECTRGSKHKTYNYVGERIQLKKPMEVSIGTGADKKVITYKFNNRVMKDKVVA